MQSNAGVVELADTHGSGPCARKGVKVQVLSPAPFSITERRNGPFCCGVSCFLVRNGACGTIKDTSTLPGMLKKPEREITR